MDAVIAARIQSTRPDAVARLDEAAFSAFYAKTSRAVWAYVYRVTGNAADADDIVQEAFCRLLRVGPEAAEEEWRRYLYKIASNLVVDRWRQSKRQQLDEPAQVFAAPPESGRGDDEDVARTFAKLTSRERARARTGLDCAARDDTPGRPSSAPALSRKRCEAPPA